MTKDKYNNREYNPWMYPAGASYSEQSRGITLYDHYVGQLLANGDTPFVNVLAEAELILHKRAEMLGVDL